MGELVAFGVADGVADFSGVGDAFAVGLAVAVALAALGVADGVAVGLRGSGVGVIKMTSNDGVGGMGETIDCLPFTQRKIPPPTNAMIMTGMTSTK